MVNGIFAYSRSCWTDLCAMGCWYRVRDWKCIRRTIRHVTSCTCCYEPHICDKDCEDECEIGVNVIKRMMILMFICFRIFQEYWLVPTFDKGKIAADPLRKESNWLPFQPSWSPPRQCHLKCTTPIEATHTSPSHLFPSFQREFNVFFKPLLVFSREFLPYEYRTCDVKWVKEKHPCQGWA